LPSPRRSSEEQAGANRGVMIGQMREKSGSIERK